MIEMYPGFALRFSNEAQLDNSPEFFSLCYIVRPYIKAKGGKEEERRGGVSRRKINEGEGDKVVTESFMKFL